MTNRCSRRSCWSLVAVIICLLLGAGVAWSQQPPQSIHQHNGNADKPASENANAKPEDKTAAAQTADDNSSGGNEEKAQTDDKPSISRTGWFISIFETHDKFWVAFGTIVIAAFTAILGFSTIFLWRATRQLVVGAEDTARRQLRPYVFLDPQKEMTFVRHPSISETVEIEIHVRNLGLTPAHDVIGIGWVALEKWPLPDSFTFVGPFIEDQPVTRSVIPPNGMAHYHTGSARSMTPAELAAIESGELRLYVYGHIHYADSFGRPHWTNFCHASTALGKQGFRTATAKCDRHNDADRE